MTGQPWLTVPVGRATVTRPTGQPEKGNRATVSRPTGQPERQPGHGQPANRATGTGNRAPRSTGQPGHGQPVKRATGTGARSIGQLERATGARSTGQPGTVNRTTGMGNRARPTGQPAGQLSQDY